MPKTAFKVIRTFFHTYAVPLEWILQLRTFLFAKGLDQLADDDKSRRRRRLLLHPC